MSIQGRLKNIYISFCDSSVGIKTKNVSRKKKKKTSPRESSNKEISKTRFGEKKMKMSDRFVYYIMPLSRMPQDVYLR